MADKVEVYKDVIGGWRWKVVAGNGQVIATPGESFTTKWGARRSAKRNRPDLFPSIFRKPT